MCQPLIPSRLVSLFRTSTASLLFPWSYFTQFSPFSKVLVSPSSSLFYWSPVYFLINLTPSMQACSIAWPDHPPSGSRTSATFDWSQSSLSRTTPANSDWLSRWSTLPGWSKKTFKLLFKNILDRCNCQQRFSAQFNLEFTGSCSETSLCIVFVYLCIKKRFSAKSNLTFLPRVLMEDLRVEEALQLAAKKVIVLRKIFDRNEKHVCLFRWKRLFWGDHILGTFPCPASCFNKQTGNSISISIICSTLA